MTRPYWLIAVLSMLLFFSAASGGHEKLRIACLPDFSPFAEYDRDAGWRGPDVDIIREMFRRSGLELDIVMRPIKRLFMQMNNGDIDGACAMFRRPERDAWASYIVPVHYSDYKIFVRLGGEFAFTGKTTELAGKRVGKSRGYSLGAEFDAARELGYIKVVEGNSYKGLVEMLQAGRVDAFVGNAQIFQRSIDSLGGQSQIVALPVRYFSIPSYFSLSKNSSRIDVKAVGEKLARAYAEMLADDFMEEMSAQYPHYNFREQ